MKENRVDHLNSKASDPKNKPEEVLKLIGLKRGDIIADIGAGGGYFTFRFSEIVGKSGQVFAVDTNREYLDSITLIKKNRGAENILTVEILPGEPGLQDNVFNIIFMRNVTHHIEDRVNYFRLIKKSLKSDGYVIIIDYKRGRFFQLWRLLGHFIKREKIMGEMNEAGFYLDHEYDILPEQYFFVFKKSEKKY